MILLPDFNDTGELPPGVYAATLEEAADRFGSGSAQRFLVTERLKRVFRLATQTGKLQRLFVYGSYITRKHSPNDVDIVLVMQNDFVSAACGTQEQLIFDHEQADREFGASIFWIRPALLILETLDEFIAHWQVKRDGTLRGIVEIVP